MAGKVDFVVWVEILESFEGLRYINKEDIFKTKKIWLTMWHIYIKQT